MKLQEVVDNKLEVAGTVPVVIDKPITTSRTKDHRSIVRGNFTMLEHIKLKVVHILVAFKNLMERKKSVIVTMESINNHLVINM